MQWVCRVTEDTISWSILSDASWKLFRNWPGEDWRSVSEKVVELSFMLAILILPLVAMWTLALIPLRLLVPRPRFRRLACQPGMMASCASGVAIVFFGLQLVLAVMLANRGLGLEPLESMESVEIIPLVPIFVGLAVLASWMTMLVGQRWRHEPSWVDRLGRAMGVFWIMAGSGMSSTLTRAIGQFPPVRAGCYHRMTLCEQEKASESSDVEAVNRQ